MTLRDIYCQPTKVICWIARRYQEPCLQRHYSVSHYCEPFKLILDFSWLLVCAKGQVQIWKYWPGRQGTRCKGTLCLILFPITSPPGPVNRAWVEVKTWFLLSEVLDRLLCGLNHVTKPKILLGVNVGEGMWSGEGKENREGDTSAWEHITTIVPPYV